MLQHHAYQIPSTQRPLTLFTRHITPAPTAVVFSYHCLSASKSTHDRHLNMQISNPALPQGSLVVVIGANGHIAAETCEKLLQVGYRVRGTVRDLARPKWMQQLFNPKYPNMFELVRVVDFGKEGAFDQAFEGRTILALFSRIVLMMGYRSCRSYIHISARSIQRQSIGVHRPNHSNHPQYPLSRRVPRQHKTFRPRFVLHGRAERCPQSTSKTHPKNVQRCSNCPGALSVQC